MRSQLALLVKQPIGRVRRRTSRKQRSMTLVVRSITRCTVGKARNASSSSRSSRTHATALGARAIQCHSQVRNRATASRRVGAR
jgi:hypothetical protein